MDRCHCLGTLDVKLAKAALLRYGGLLGEL
jgi:hypothetical protein